MNKYISLVVGIALLVSCERPKKIAAPKGVIRQSNGSVADVQAKCDASADGDTVTMPDGIFDWGPTLKITKAITLKGNARPDSATGKIDTSHTVVRDTTVTGPIIALNAQVGEPEFPTEWHPGDKYVRITGIAFEKHPTVQPDNHPAFVVSTTVPFRFDHLSTNGLYHGGNVIDVLRYNYGVIDHCVHRSVVGVSFGEGLVWARFGHAIPDKGDYAFSRPANFGGYDWVFVEDNWVWHCSDITAGGKLVWRYNHIAADECCRMGGHCASAGSFVSHGIGNNGSSGWRGGRGYELYNNVLQYDDPVANQASMDGITSGSVMWHDNTLSNRSASGTIQDQVVGLALNDYRFYNNEGGVFDGASGFSKWDINCKTRTGWTCTSEGEGPGVVFYEGTTGTGTTSSSITVTDPSPGFPAPDGLKGYSVYRVSDGMTHLITGNTANTLTIFGSMHGGNPPKWVSGQTFRIGKVAHSFDAPTWGAGDLINRNAPAWDHSVIETAYAWNNVDIDRGQQVHTVGRCTSITPGCFNLVEGSAPAGYKPYTYPHPLVTYTEGGLPTPVPTPSGTQTPTPTGTATATATISPTATAAATATATATQPPAPTQSATATIAPSPSPTVAPTPTATSTIAPTPTTPPSIPSAPSNLNANPGNPKRSITLQWQINGSVDSIEIERGDNASEFVQVATVLGNVTEFIDRDLVSGQRYFYRIRARNSAGVSEYSNTANAPAK
jgi:hypothetical protein